MIKKVEYQPISLEIWEKKYKLSTKDLGDIDTSIDDTNTRVARALSDLEKNSDFWFGEFKKALDNGAIPAGRILSNAGAKEHKPSTSLINCTVSDIIEDSIEGIVKEACGNASITLSSGAGIGYEFSTLRPRGAYVSGVGAYTSGPLSFMDVFDKMCFTISSAGGRRGAQMGTFAIWHPDVEDFIKAKREDGRLRQFNLSLLIDDEFMEAVKNDKTFDLVFPLLAGEEADITTWKDLFWDEEYCVKAGYQIENKKILCKVYKTVQALELWDTIMKSTYDYAEPGFMLIDEINRMNNNSFTETIRCTNPCGEQPLPPDGSCLLGSLNLTKFIIDDYEKGYVFDFEKFSDTVRVFTRMLDNVVEINGLPLESQRFEIESKRRHGMGITGLGSTLAILGLKYGSLDAVRFTGIVMHLMSLVGFREGIRLAKEKGCAPYLEDLKNREAWASSPYMERLFGHTLSKEEALKYGCRFTHHTSIAPTGTISLSIGNNVSNGVEPSFSHKYTRNIIKEGKSAKTAEVVYSYEGLFWEVNHPGEALPESFVTTEDISPKNHIDMQSAAQYWCDSSISKTINVPTNTPFEDFKDIYMYAYDKNLKGVTTFRFNPEVFQGVLVKDEDLENTRYAFTLENGDTIEAKGNEIISYGEEEFTAANLHDAIKEGYYGKL
jgi:ribonucleoside-diphosphate reductase alpha chain